MMKKSVNIELSMRSGVKFGIEIRDGSKGPRREAAKRDITRMAIN